MRVQHIDLLLEHIVDGYHNIWPERLRPREAVAVVQKYGVPRQGRGIFNDVGHDDHVRSVLHRNTRVSVVRMIVVGAWPNHDVRLPLTDLADDLLADI